MPYPRKSGLISPSATDAHRHEYSIGTGVSRFLKKTEWQNPCRAHHPLVCLRYWKRQCAQYLHTALGCLWLVAPTGNELTRERAASSSTSPGIRDCDSLFQSTRDILGNKPRNHSSHSKNATESSQVHCDTANRHSRKVQCSTHRDRAD